MSVNFSIEAVTKEVVTPEMASKWLEKNTQNRVISQRVVDAYTKDMKDGRWDLTSDTIKFAKDGTLLDGQHRLWAIVESCTPVEIWVATGVNRSMNIDCGRSRNYADRIIIGGIDEAGGFMTSRTVGSATTFALRMNSAVINNKAPVDYVVAFMKQHEAGLKFVDELVRCNRRFVGVCTAPVYVALLSAYEAGVKPDKLQEWYKICVTGMYESKNGLSALRFRNFIIEFGTWGTSLTKAYEVINKAEYSIDAFQEERSISCLKNIKIYPTPDFNAKSVRGNSK